MKSVALIYPRSSGAFIPNVAKLLRNNFEVIDIPYETGETIDFGTPDVAWIEWAVPSSGELAKHLHSCGAKVILRTHRYEIHEPGYKDIPWRFVDRAVFVGPRQAGQAKPKLGFCAERTVVLPNALDMSAFPLQAHAPGKVIGVAAAIRGIKQPGFWVALMKALPEDYSLRICGSVDDRDLFEYVLESASRHKLDIKHDGFIPADRMASWWGDKSWCFSSSAIESQGMNYLEAAACGVRPLIGWFPGCEDIVRRDWIWTDLLGAVGKIKWMPSEVYDPSGLRSFVEGRYGIEALRPRYVKLIEEVLS